MTDQQFEAEKERLFSKYCPILLHGVPYGYKIDELEKYVNKMKEEVMKIDGVEDDKKMAASIDIANMILDRVRSHNKNLTQ